MRKLFAILAALAAFPMFAQTAKVSVKGRVVTVTCVSPANPTYTNAAGTVVVTCKLPTPPVTVPVIASFTATPATVTAGQSTLVSYSITGATSASIAGVSMPATSDSETITPTATVTYTLTATNSAGSVSKSLTITVTQPVAPPPPPPPPPGTGTALSACKDLTASGTYYLANDVTSAGTCFGIDANGITLNLNGHTITYGTGGGNAPTPAIEGHDCWSTSNPIDSGPCGSAHGGLEVYGGTIVQSPNSATFSPVFGFGQGTFSTAPYIHDITATFQNTGAQFYYSSFIVPGARIENNIVNDNVTDIDEPGQDDESARSAFQGQAIYIKDSRDSAGVGDTISGNTIAGSPQGGVYSDNQHTAVTGNDISMNSRYSNDFCDAMAADYQTFENNNCHPLSGRGVHINANYNIVSGNTIAVTELPNNSEYGGCEGGGAYGVQLEFDDSFLPTPPVGDVISGNTITATANACNAVGLRVTAMTSAGNASFTGNTVTTTNSGLAGVDTGISVDTDSGGTVSYTGNTFSAKDSFVYVDWDGGSVNVGANTWLTTPVYTVMAEDGGCDPSQSDSLAVCPVSVTMTDVLPDTVKCGGQSTATVSIDGKTSVCKPIN